MTVFLFPDQGSQRKGMGDALFNEFKEVTARADEMLGYSIKELCF
jgi:malonyl CoA-acyl carrier protein transacylase